jgi:hypothetical protein
VIARDLYTLIETIVKRTVVPLKMYYGKVEDNSDPDNMGKVKCSVPSLGFIDASAALWCSPRRAGVIVPKVGQWVEVGFAEGNLNKPFYGELIGEIANNLPTNFSGANTSIVLFEDPNDSGTYMKIDLQNKQVDFSLPGFKVVSDGNQNTGTLTIGNKTIEVGSTGTMTLNTNVTIDP